MWPVRGAPSAVHTRNPPRWERTVGHLLTKILLKFIDSLAFNDQRWKMEDGRRRPLLIDKWGFKGLRVRQCEAAIKL